MSFLCKVHTELGRHDRSQRISQEMNDFEAEKPLTCHSFYKVWREYCDKVKIMKPGSDYCNKCTQINNILCNDLDEDTRLTLEDSLKLHRAEAAAEFANPIKMQDNARENPNSGELHLVFDFAEKEILAHFLRQHGQLHFTTGLNFDLFCVSISNIKSFDIHFLP